MALGAQRWKLIWMVLREVFVMAAAGLAIGLPVALATTKFVKSFLFEMQPNDPWAIAGAAGGVALAGGGGGPGAGTGGGPGGCRGGGPPRRGGAAPTPPSNPS